MEPSNATTGSSSNNVLPQAFSQYYEQLTAALRGNQEHIAADVKDIKSDMRELRAQISSMGSVLAALPAQYVTASAFERLGERISGELKAVAIKLEQETQKLAERVDSLETARDRQSGSTQLGIYAVGLIFTLINIAIVSKGKLW